jgi:hypothetical protein
MAWAVGVAVTRAVGLLTTVTALISFDVSLGASTADGGEVRSKGATGRKRTGETDSRSSLALGSGKGIRRVLDEGTSRDVSAVDVGRVQMARHNKYQGRRLTSGEINECEGAETSRWESVIGGGSMLNIGY